MIRKTDNSNKTLPCSRRHSQLCLARPWQVSLNPAPHPCVICPPVNLKHGELYYAVVKTKSMLNHTQHCRVLFTLFCNTLPNVWILPKCTLAKKTSVVASKPYNGFNCSVSTLQCIPKIVLQHMHSLSSCPGLSNRTVSPNCRICTGQVRDEY